MKDPLVAHEKFGSIIGIAPGNVPVYSSDYESADDTEFPDRKSYRSYLDGQYMGQKWQCVEFARRWLYVNFGCVFDEVAMAYDIFRLRSVRHVESGGRLPLAAFRNGSKRAPEPGGMLIWDEGGKFSTTGHVAIITEVGADFIRIAEQNFRHHAWPEDKDHSRELALTVSEAGEYHVDDSEPETHVLGWVLQTEDDLHAEPHEEIDPGLLNIQLREVQTDVPVDSPWLDPNKMDEATFIITMEGHSLMTDIEDQLKYLVISETAQAELKRATTELHALFMAATEHVLRHEKLFERFNIPKALLPRIRQSWSNRRNEMITGRFDFALSERGLKVYEYNCDSASCHLEAGKVQGLWADHFGCIDGFDAGRSLVERLVTAWKKAHVDDVVHIMHDRDVEETYHAWFMKDVIEKAGLPTKVLRGTRGLRWKRDGSIVDRDGTPIRWVWKTWAWETALDQIRAECEEDAESMAKNCAPPKRRGPPRLVDVLLRPDVMVYEPLWTLIPSNKAILPVLWRLIPNHPYLLNSAFELRKALKKTGYAVKPIVGRGGANISLIDQADTLMLETAGKFEHRDQVYQELWPLPHIDGFNVQICTFSAGGAYAGACSRVDHSAIINMESDCMPLRVVPDRELLKSG